MTSTQVHVPYSKSGVSQFIIDALQDPYHPTQCGGSLLAAIQRLPLRPHAPTKKDEIRRQSTLFDVLYRFLIVKRPIDGLKEWMERFLTCKNCKKSGYYGRAETAPSATVLAHATWQTMKHGIIRDYHSFCATVPQLRADPDARFPPEWCKFATCAMHLINLSFDCDFKIIARGRNKLWPANIPVLVPFNPDQITESILQWYLIYPDPTIIRFFSGIWSTCRAVFNSSCTKHRLFGLVVDSMKQSIDTLLDVLDGSTKLDSAEVMIFCETFSVFPAVFLCILGLGLCLDHYLPHTKLMLSDGNEVKIVQLLSILIIVYPEFNLLPLRHQRSPPNIFFILKQMLEYSRKVYRRFDLHEFDLHPLLLADHVVNHDREILFGSHHGFETELGHHMQWSNGVTYGCSAKAHGCDEQLETAGTKLKFCEACLGVYYCSRECQARDWNDEEHPHKLICGPLSKIVKHCPVELVDDRPPNHILEQAARCGISDLERVLTIRNLIKRAKLTPEEMGIIKAWGRRTYEIHKVKPTQWQPGFEDYDAIVQRLTDPKGIFKAGPSCYQVGRMSDTPTEGVAIQKALLLAKPL